MKKDFGYDKNPVKMSMHPEEIHQEQIKRLLEEQPVDKKKAGFEDICPVGSSCAVFALVIIGG